MKSKNKALALLLSLMMVISMNPAIIFAQDVASTDPPAVAAEDVTPADVHESLEQAVDSELDAALEFIPSPEFWNELDAAVNDADADSALTDAEGIVEEADKATDAAADSAENSLDKTIEASDHAKSAADDAESYADDASQAKDDAVSAATKAEAQQAADTAKDAAGEAQKEALNAVAYAEIASSEAANAKAEYDKAKEAYDAAQAQVNEKLAQGLIDAEEAAELTAAVKARMDEADEAMREAQQKAAEAAEQAAARADAADELLNRQIEELDQIIKDTAGDVAQKTGTAALTGAALAAAKIAAEASKLEVSYYEGKIETKQESIDELNKKIADAQTKIEAAKAVVEAKDAALIEATDDYEAKKAALAEAREELSIAQQAVDKVKDIIEQRESSGIKESLAAVRTGEYSDTDVRSIAAYLMNNDPELEWDETEKDVFYIEDRAFKVSVFDVLDNETEEVIDRIVRIDVFIPAHDEDVEKLPDAEKEWKGGDKKGTQPTDMTFHYGKSTSGDVVLRRAKDGKLDYQIVYKGNRYTIRSDNKGFYITRNNKKYYITLTVFVEDEIIEEVENTSEIAQAWDDASEKEAALETSEAAFDGAFTARNLAALALGKAQLERNLAEAKLNRLVDRQKPYIERRDKLVEEVSELDDKLNGNLAEQFIVAYLDGGIEGMSEKLVESIETVLGPEEKARYDGIVSEIRDLQARWEDASRFERLIIAMQITAKELSIAGIVADVVKTADIDLVEIEKQGAAIAEVIRSFQDGNISKDDVKSVADLLTNSGFAANTRNRIIDKIVEYLTVAHHNAVVNLDTAVKDGAKNISDATENVAKASAGAVAAHTASSIADAAKKIADARAKEAADRKAAADKAAEDAANALADYQALAEIYGPDEDNLDRAREAYETAQAYADRAASDAVRAEFAAEQAQSDYEAAQKAADEKADPVPPTPPTPPTPVPPTPVNPDDPVVPDNGGSGRRSAASGSGSAVQAIMTAASSVTDLGIDIATFADGLKGNRYAEAVGNDESKLNTKAFVDYVYSYFGIQLDLDGDTVEKIAKNGTLVDNADRQPGDLMIITDKDGKITGFAVNYDKNSYIRYSKKSGKVESFETKDLNDNYRVVRVY